MRPELWREIEGELRLFLRRQRERPQMLAEASLHENHNDGRAHLRLVLVDGTDWHAPLNGECFAYYGAGDARLFSRDCVRLYSQLYEDHLLEVQLRQLRMPTDRELLYDFRPGDITWVDQVGDFGTAVMYGNTFATSEVGDPQAQSRALELLKANLSPQQLAQYQREKVFEVVGGDTGKRYRIRHGRQMNIDELDSKGEKVCGWCFLPQGGLAAGDVMLGQKIALECDEKAALKVANRFGSETMTLGEVASRYMPLPGAQARFFGVDPAS